MTLSISEEQILLKKDWMNIRSLLEEKNQRLDELSKKCALYERIAKERAQRARKKASDPSGYACIAIREIIDYYERELSRGKKERVPIVAYKTTLSMPYPSQLGFSELRRLLLADLVGAQAGLSETENSLRKDVIRPEIRFDKFIRGFPADEKHPGPFGIDWDPQTCILYRVMINIGKKFPEADLYSTQPLDIPIEMME